MGPAFDETACVRLIEFSFVVQQLYESNTKIMPESTSHSIAVSEEIMKLKTNVDTCEQDEE